MSEYYRERASWAGDTAGLALPFIVDISSTTGKICERYATYEEARRRVDQFPAETIIGIPFIFQELPDGSQRLVREDGKPLQWHRRPDDAPPTIDEPLPLTDEPCDGTSPIRVVALHPDRGKTDEANG